mmetsp:Transcript_4680/g.13866  ORF Transcript_4680/g.13866 Transcript_4680/m.13866 type:complete len:234 (-) Transcript_4680:1096-1797(-)
MAPDWAPAKPWILELAQPRSSGSATGEPSPLSSFSMSTVCWRMSCHMTARISFLLPSAMSTPPMFTRTRSILPPVATTRLPFSTTWWRLRGARLTFFHGTMPGDILSMTARMGTPLQHSAKRSRTCTASALPGPAGASRELIQSLKVRASRVSPASSRSRSASSRATDSSTASRPGQSLKSCATKARLSFALPAATSRALMKGSTPTPRAFCSTASARAAGSWLKSTGRTRAP